MKVIKRDGREVTYDRGKIIIAIHKANDEVPISERISDEKIHGIVASIEKLGVNTLQVEEIQDIIEQKLMAERKFVLAKTYIIYRYQRQMIRKSNTTDESILGLIEQTNKYAMEENSIRMPLLLQHSVTLLQVRYQETLLTVFFFRRKYRRRMRKVFFTFMTLIILCSRFLTAVLST